METGLKPNQQSICKFFIQSGGRKSERQLKWDVSIVKIQIPENAYENH